ncbi:unnamed protein product, partial [Candidula unifasciata]
MYRRLCMAPDVLKLVKIAHGIVTQSGNQRRHFHCLLEEGERHQKHAPELLQCGWGSDASVNIDDVDVRVCVWRNCGFKPLVAWRRLGIKENDFLTVGTFTWIRENNILNRVLLFKISHWNLIIKAVQKEDEGTYQCQITDKVPLRTHVYLTVKQFANNPSP